MGGFVFATFHQLRRDQPSLEANGLAIQSNAIEAAELTRFGLRVGRIARLGLRIYFNESKLDESIAEPTVSVVGDSLDLKDHHMEVRICMRKITIEAVAILALVIGYLRERVEDVVTSIVSVTSAVDSLDYAERQSR